MSKLWRSTLAPLLMLAGCASSGSPVTVAETGTHWAAPADFPALARLGYQFVVVTVDPANPAAWAKPFDAAQAAGLELIVGVHPPPYRLRDGAWTISKEGKAFLEYAASRPSLVKAIFVYNEPYWIDPFTEAKNPCGALSAAQLRGLRSAIRDVWPEARIYHDIGHPSRWAPGGDHPRWQPCIGDKYADATGVADLVGVWAFPFETDGYHRSKALRILRREIDYVRDRMQALPVLANQAFRCRGCGEATRWPTAEELKDWNQATRALGPYAISWYPWRQASYDDYLANHPEMWNLTR